MDTQRSSFGTDGGQSLDDPGAEAPGIEAPPLVGQDERRMHVRAYNHWARLLAGRSFPSIEALDVDSLGDFGPHSVLLDFTSGIENPALAFVGDALARECALDGDVQYIADVPRRSLLSRLTDHYLQIIANRAPIGFEAEFVNSTGATILYRGVLLPFSSDDDTIDFILGVINWKQAAEPALVQAIAEEMEAASAAVPHARPTVPVWANDGDAANEPIDDEEDDGAMPSRSLSSQVRPRLAPMVEDDVLELEDEAAIDEIADFADEGAMGLADWLAAARVLADSAAQANARGHAALYQAIGRAWGFARAAEQAPEDYAELLDEAGIVASARAPMTPVVKLVFGLNHDKTRLAEYAAVLGHARRQDIAPAALPTYLSGYDGGMKALLRDIRAAGKADAPVKPPLDAAVVLRGVGAFGSIDWPEAPEGDYVVLLARREADGSLSLIAAEGESHQQTQRLMAHAAKMAS